MSEYIVDVTGMESGDYAIAREEIVRCRDCKHFAANIHGSYCKKSITTLSDANGFCAWGERKTNGQDAEG